MTDRHPPMESHYGSTVRGPQRYRRPEIEERFDSTMLGSNGAKMFGLRRIGKSTEAVACADRLRAAGHTVIEIDTQGMVSEADLLMRLHGGLPPHSAWGNRLLKAIAGEGAIAAAAREALKQQNREGLQDVAAYFNPIAAAIEQTLAFEKEAKSKGDAERLDTKLLLFVDELPWLCRTILEGDAQRGRERIDRLFAALRRWRDAGMGMLFIGSIGLVGLGRRYRLDMSHLNDLTTLAVPPFEDRKEALAFVAALAEGRKPEGWTPEHGVATVDESAAWYPAMLQKAFLELTLGGHAAPLGRIPDIFADKVRPELDKAFFEQFDRRIRAYRDSQDPWANRAPSICEAALGAPGPIAREELRSRIEAQSPGEPSLDEADLGDALDMLREDGFLEVRIDRDGNQLWRPASPLVVAWRRRRRGGR